MEEEYDFLPEGFYPEFDLQSISPSLGSGPESNPGLYETSLDPDQEALFQEWKKKYAPDDSGADYDLRGAFLEGLTPGENGHWSDAYKKPNHPTFSDQSKYAKFRPDLAGSWDGETYISASGSQQEYDELPEGFEPEFSPGQAPGFETEPYRRPVGFFESAGRGIQDSLLGLGQAVNKNVFYPALKGVGEAADLIAPGTGFAEAANAPQEWWWDTMVQGPQQLREDLAINPEEEEQGIGGKLGSTVGSFIPDIAAAAVTSGASRGLQAAEKGLEVGTGLMGAIKSLLPELSQGATSFALPAMKYGMDAEKRARDAGKDDVEAIAMGLLASGETMANAAMPFGVTSGMKNAGLRFLSRTAQSAPLAIAQVEAGRQMHNALDPENKQPFSLEDTLINSIPMALLGGVMGKAERSKIQLAREGAISVDTLRKSDSPETAKAIQSLTAEKIAGVDAQAGETISHLDSQNDRVPKEKYEGPMQEQIRAGNPITVEEAQSNFVDLPKGYVRDPNDGERFIYSPEIEKSFLPAEEQAKAVSEKTKTISRLLQAYGVEKEVADTYGENFQGDFKNKWELEGAALQKFKDDGGQLKNTKGDKFQEDPTFWTIKGHSEAEAQVLADAARDTREAAEADADTNNLALRDRLLSQNQEQDTIAPKLTVDQYPDLQSFDEYTDDQNTKHAEITQRKLPVNKEEAQKVSSWAQTQGGWPQTPLVLSDGDGRIAFISKSPKPDRPYQVTYMEPGKDGIDAPFFDDAAQSLENGVELAFKRGFTSTEHIEYGRVKGPEEGGQGQGIETPAAEGAPGVEVPVEGQPTAPPPTEVGGQAAVVHPEVQARIDSLPEGQREKAQRAFAPDETPDPWTGEALTKSEPLKPEENLDLVSELGRIGALEENATAGSVLDYLASDADSPGWVRNVSGVLRDFGKDVSVDVVYRPDSTWAALFQGGDNGRILINTARPSANIAATMLHEVAHKATLAKIRGKVELNSAETSAVKGLNKIFKAIQERSEFKEEYGKSSLEEFVAEVFGDAGFRAKLDSLEFSKDVSFFRKIANAISQLLFGKTSKQNSLLDEAVSNALDLAGAEVIEASAPKAPIEGLSGISLEAYRAGLKGDDKWLDSLVGKHPHLRNELQNTYGRGRRFTRDMAANAPDEQSSRAIVPRGNWAETLTNRHASSDAVGRSAAEALVAANLPDELPLTDQQSKWVEDHLPLAGKIANQFRNVPGQSYDELNSEARMALIKAAKTHDPERGAFATHAMRVVKQTLIDLFRKQGRRVLREESLQNPIGSEEGLTLQDTLEAPMERPVPNANAIEVINKIKAEILPRYLEILNDYGGGMSLREVAGKHDISQEGVRKIINREGAKIATALQEAGFRSAEDIFPPSEERAHAVRRRPVAIEDEAVADPATVGRLEAADDKATEAILKEDDVEELVAPSIAKSLKKMRDDIKEQFDPARKGTRHQISVDREVADNRASQYAIVAGNDIRGPMKRMIGWEDTKNPLKWKAQEKALGQAEDALSFVVEAQRDKNILQEWMNDIAVAASKNPEIEAIAERAINALKFAQENWDKLENLAGKYERITRSQVSQERASGKRTLIHKGYVMHLQEMDQPTGGGGGGISQSFLQPRTYPTFAASITDGINPKTLNAVDLLQARVASGQRAINYQAWVDSLKKVKDPRSGESIVKPLEEVKRVDGTTLYVAPRGYKKESLGGSTVAVMRGYEGIIGALTKESALDVAGMRQLQRATAVGKTSALLLDTFHLGRLAAWSSAIKAAGIRTFKAPIPSFKKGLALLDYSVEELKAMDRAGQLKTVFGNNYGPEMLGNILERKRLSNLAISKGFNIGRVEDAIHAEWIHSLPGIGRFNKFLFGQFQKGAMMESWLLEFGRMRKMFPEWTEGQVAARVSRDLNTRFGTLNRQGWIKSKTFRDIAMLLFLAPRWNEGLIRSELGSIAQLGEFGKDLVTGKGFRASSLLRATGTMLVGQFVANQLINYITRGKPTWENEEEGIGAKISAWIPDYIGNGPGFFLNPMSIAYETAHILHKAYESSRGADPIAKSRDAASGYLRSRLSATLGPGWSMATGKDILGDRPEEGWKQIPFSGGIFNPGFYANQIPTPIPLKPAIGGLRQIISRAAGQESNVEVFPGQFQKQLMSTLGLKTDQAPGPGKRISSLARHYNEEVGATVPTDMVEFFGGPYTDLTKFLQMNNVQDARSAMEELLKTKTPEQIRKHFQRYPDVSFTGSKAREVKFKQTLNPEQREQYKKAIEDRIKVRVRAFKILNEVKKEVGVE